MTTTTDLATLSNEAYRLQVQLSGRDVLVTLRDLAMDADLAHGPYTYRASRTHDEGTLTSSWLRDATVRVEGQSVRIRGTLAGVTVEHRFTLPTDNAHLEERISLHNLSGEVVVLQDLACGLRRPISDHLGELLPVLSGDRLVAVPLRHRATDPAGSDDDFAVTDFVTGAGREHRMDNLQGHGYVPSWQRFSEGWAWTHGEHALGIFKFNQQGMEFSVLATEVATRGAPNAVALRFGGAAMISGEPSSLGRIRPGETIDLGVTRFQTVNGDYTRVYAVFRDFLDEHGCGLPRGYDAPVHWNELYDNPEWHVGTPGHPAGPRNTRPLIYTRAAMLREAEKARDYSCEARPSTSTRDGTRPLARSCGANGWATGAHSPGNCAKTMG